MKRVGLVFASICMVCLLTGCGGKEKKLECSYTVDEEGISVKQVFTLNFNKKDQYSSGSLKQDSVLSEDMLKVYDLNTYKTAFETNTVKKQFKDVKYELTDNGKDTVSLNVNISQKDMESITGYKNLTGSESAKETFEKSGYTCKLN